MSELVIIAPAERQQHLPLLFEADDAHDHVVAHLDEGELFGWSPTGSDAVVGAVQAVPRTPSLWELTLVAVDPACRGQGHGTAMVEAVVAELAQRHARRVVVATATSGPRQFAFYQRCGFRPLTIERDHFDVARGYDGTESENGIPVRDVVWLDRLLG